MMQWTLLLLLVLEASCSARQSLIQVTRRLKVKRGQSADLQEGDLRFDVPSLRDACKVEVVLNEPITQRVGKLMPQVFDCHYRPHEVKYVHNGCPLLTEDIVKLRLYRLTETETYVEEFLLHVDIVEPDCGIIRFGLKSLEVSEFYGLSEPLDGNVVSFQYERRPNLECAVHLGRLDGHLPAHGRLVTGEPERAAKRGDVPESFIHQHQQLDNKARAQCTSDDCMKGLKMMKLTRVSCDDFLLMGLRYQHTEPPSPDTDYVAIRLELKDTRSGSTYQSERAWIPVRISGAASNQPPRPSFMSAFILEVDQFILTPLSTATLDADDDESPKQLLVFNVTKPPEQGFITHLSDHTRPISSFTWLDLNHMLVGYQPPNSSDVQRRNYEAEFEAHDFFFKKSSAMTVHMSVRNADTNAPRVSWNIGLSLLEGQSRPITWEQLQVVDNDDLKAVRIVAVDGLQHGQLTIRGTKGLVFTVSDIRAGVVHYHHDDSDTTKDFITFRITDGPHQTRHKFPVKVLPKDDTPPFLITNMLVEVPEGRRASLTSSSLQAADMDSTDDYILFNITSPPRAGEVMKVPGGGLADYPVRHFLQKDLTQSVIYYRHRGHKVFADSFEVVLSDYHDPPNLSEPQVVMVHIEPAPDQPPEEIPGSSRCLVLKETEVVYITRRQLHFTDQESSDGELTFAVTTPPSYVGPDRLSDAGRLFLVDSVPKFTKDTNTPALRVFTQQAVNFMKVAYMPPIEDIGPYPKEVQFVLSVTNRLGKTVPGICFNVTVMPVDNQPPQVVASLLTVDEGGQGGLGSQNLMLSDVDSLEEALRVALQREPRHGRLLLDNVPLQSQQTFTLQDVKQSRLRYRHDDSETTEDHMEFTVTDGTNSASFIIQVKILPINDQVPVMVAGLRAVLSCAEGQETSITAEYIHATDADSDNNTLAFLIARQPSLGVVLRNGVAVDRFTQADVAAGRVTYKHTGLEIGLSPRHDTITLVVSDGELPARAAPTRDSLPVYDLQVKVLPVDSHPPSLTTGDLFVVDEGGTALITASHLKAFDADTAVDSLTVTLITPPQFGYIENILPTPGFEKSNTGISIDSFPYKDVLEGHVNYVQSRHQRMEPTADHLMLCVTDGKHSSAHVPFYVIINPTNDEIPQFVAHNITVREGEMKPLDSLVLNVMDLDVPRDVLHFSVVKPPEHGSIVNHGGGRPLAKRQEAGTLPPVVAFTWTDLTDGMDLMYEHDDSENMKDSFTIRLSDGRHELRRKVTVTVLPVNDEQPHVVRNNGLVVEPGETRVISSVALFAQDNDSPSSEVTYMFERVSTRGLLQLKEEQDWVTLADGRNCTQEMVDMNLLRYVHTELHAAKKEDFFVFHLLDGKSRSPSQHFHILVKDLEKGNIAVSVRPLNVSRGDRVVLTTDVLSAADGSDRPEELLYIVTSPPLHGYIEYIKHPGLAIASFSQMDVAANVIAYVHNNQASAAEETFQFVVSNGKTSRNGSFHIVVEMVDRVLPSLSTNQGLTVPQGSAMILGPDRLFLSDPDTPPGALTFVLLQPPQYGTLSLAGETLSAGSNFTQSNVTDLELMYRHDGGPSQIDRFGFLAADSTNRGFLLDGRLHPEPVFFTIQISPVDKLPPEVVKLRPLWRVERFADGRYGIFLSSRELKAEDGGSQQDVTFCIVRPPYFGYLENVTSGGFVSRRFSQTELTKRSVAYMVNVEEESLSDSLEFRVSDPLGNMGPSHILDFRWSRVELSQQRFFTCEEQETLSIDVIRTGNLEESSYITVKVKDLTAAAGKDFLLKPSSLIQFDPGVSKQSWQVEVVSDHLEEADETFKVLLQDPEGTVIGRNDKALVYIRDSGRCRLNLDGSGPVLGGKEVRSDVYPRHGSIQLDKPPQDSDPHVWTRGDGGVQGRGDGGVPGRGDGVVPVRGDGGVPVRGDGGVPGRGDGGVPGRGDGGVPGERVNLHKKLLRVRPNSRSIAPSTVYHNGTDIVYTYHGIVQMKVEDETSAAGGGRRANVRVLGRGQQPSAALAKPPHRHRKPPQPEPAGQNQDQIPGLDSISKPCVPELRGLLHYSQNTNQLFHCNGVSWKLWTATDEMVRAQACPQGWTFHGGHCFILSMEHKVTWSSANRACKERYKGTLASVLSGADMDWLWDFSGRKAFWIGLNDREGRGRWEWAGGQAVGYTNWRDNPSSTPTRPGGGGKCVLVWRRAKWQSKDCRSSRGHRFICSRTA